MLTMSRDNVLWWVGINANYGTVVSGGGKELAGINLVAWKGWGGGGGGGGGGGAYVFMPNQIERGDIWTAPWLFCPPPRAVKCEV